MQFFITLDGSEGGGQLLRTALALSALTSQPFEITNIRASRPSPGLRPQHLACIKILQTLCNADVSGAEEGSQCIKFIPKKLKTKSLVFDIGTAGSITLLLQSILPPFIFGKNKVSMELTGGTDVAWSMQVDYLANVFIPQIKKFADMNIKIMRRGYYPKGQGKILIKIKPITKNIEEAKKYPIVLLEQKNLCLIKGIVHSSKSLAPNNVAERIAQSAKFALSDFHCPIDIRTEYCDTASDGCGITLWATFSSNKDEIINPVILGADLLGEKNKKSEVIGSECVRKLINEINSNAAVDEHLADNLIPFLAIAGGKIKTSRITAHTLTNIYVAEKFFPVKFRIDNTIIDTLSLNL